MGHPVGANTAVHAVGTKATHPKLAGTTTVPPSTTTAKQVLPPAAPSEVYQLATSILLPMSLRQSTKVEEATQVFHHLAIIPVLANKIRIRVASFV